MRLSGMHAGGKGVQPAHAMGKALIDKEFQRAISHRRLIAEAFGRQPLQHVIGPQRLVVLQQDFQHPPSHRGEARALSGRQRLGPRQHIGGAMAVVVPGKGGTRIGTAGAAFVRVMRC